MQPSLLQKSGGFLFAKGGKILPAKGRKRPLRGVVAGKGQKVGAIFLL